MQLPWEAVLPWDRAGCEASAFSRASWLPQRWARMGHVSPAAALHACSPGDSDSTTAGSVPCGQRRPAEPDRSAWGGRYVHSELIHSRFAMAGVAGILIPDILTHVGLLNVPVWYNQGLIAQQGSFAPFSAPPTDLAWPWPDQQPLCRLVVRWRLRRQYIRARSPVLVNRVMKYGYRNPDLAGER